MSFYNSEDLMEDMLISAPKLEFEDDSAKLISRFGIKVADRFDDEIHEQIIKIAKEEGLTNVFVLNKNRIAEILKIGLEAEKEINRKNAENERLTINMNAFGLGMKREKERADNARAEAIKEFAERVKNVLSFEKRVCRKMLDNDGAFMVDKIRKEVDSLIKEMGVELWHY